MHTSPLLQGRNATLIAHLPSPHRARLWGSQALCKGRTVGCAGGFLSRIDFSHSDTLPPVGMAEGLPAQIASAGSTLPCQTDGEQESTGEGMRLTPLHFRLWPAPVSLQVSYDKANFILYLFVFPMIPFTVYISALNLHSFSGIPLEDLILSSFGRNQPAHSGWSTGRFYFIYSI